MATSKNALFVRELHCAVLERLLSSPRHCGFCAPCALLSNQKFQFLEASK